jgi:hypothetical protein
MAKKAERPLPDNLDIPFIICDNTVNRYGWRLLVEGIDTEGFVKNPVCCVMHETWGVPVGKWKSLTVDNGVFKGVVEFDRNDDEAIKLYWKYKDGYMNAVSLNVLAIEESSDAKYLLPGQQRETLIKSELLEISLVTIPGQKNAVRLSSPKGDTYELKLVTSNNEQMAKDEKTVEQLQQENLALRKLNADNLVKLHQQRNVVADGEVEPLKQLAFESYDVTSKMLDARVAPAASGNHGAGGSSSVDAKTQLADQLVKLHFDRGAISDPEQVVYRASALSDYEGTKKVLEAKTGRDGLVTFTQGITGGEGSGKAADEKAGWTYLDYYKKDMRGLALMEKNDPEKFKKLEGDFKASAVSDGTIYPEAE